MNAVFHVVSGTAVAATAARALPGTRRRYVVLCVVAFLAGLAIHGLLDVAPHHYPLRARYDVLVSLALFGASLAWVRRELIPLFTAAFVGSIFPDLVDFGPRIVLGRLGLGGLWFSDNLFPWHWRAYSGSIYDGSRAALSHTLHLLVLAGSAAVIWWQRQAVRPSRPTDA